ncbi:MAG: hypothetical protein WB791_08990 [Waddliaceae bacterium]
MTLHRDESAYLSLLELFRVDLARSSNIFIALLFLLSSCASQKSYDPVHAIEGLCFSAMKPAECFLVVLVDARHLDYSNGKSLLESLAKHNDVGHAWIYLQGVVNGKTVVVEGGHSGELGILYPKYMAGVMDNIEARDPNPIRYLWETQRDGFFQKGAGSHRPTFAAKVDLTQPQFEAILAYIDPRHFDYSNYAITGNQCASFVSQVAQIAGLEIACEVTIPIEKSLSIWEKTYVLWTDRRYSFLTISSPDVVEQSLINSVRAGKGEYALSWYIQTGV